MRYLCILIGTSHGLGPDLMEIVEALQEFGVVSTSRAFLTAADGPNQPHIWNFVVVVQAPRRGEEYNLKALERKLGRRQRRGKDSPREIDMDPLFEFVSLGLRKWKVVSLLELDWEKKFYSRYPVFDCCDFVLDENGIGHSPPCALSIDARVISVLPKHLFQLASWEPGTHFRLAGKMLDSFPQSNPESTSRNMAIAVVSGKVVSQAVSEPLDSRHAEIMVLHTAIEMLGRDCAPYLWIYSTFQPCYPCLVTMVELGIAGSVWLVDRCLETSSHYHVSFDPLSVTASCEKPPILVHGILNGKVRKFVAELKEGSKASSFDAPGGGEGVSTQLSVRAFYERVFFEYGDPIIHPLSSLATAIHEDLLRSLRRSGEGLILDIGCGLQEPIENSIGVDLSSEALRIRNELYPGCLSVLSDLCALPFPPGTVSMALIGLVMDHIKHPQMAFAELFRCTVAGASVVVTVFEPKQLPVGKYKSSWFRYFSLRGLEYEVPWFGWSLADIIEMAGAEGWIQSGDLKHHILQNDDYHLVEMMFTKASSGS